MTYLMTQIFFGLVIAFLLGLLIGWLALRSAFKQESQAREAAWEEEKEEIKKQSEQPMRQLLGELDAINSRYSDHLDGKVVIDAVSEAPALTAETTSGAITYNTANEDKANEETTEATEISETETVEKPEGLVIYENREAAGHVDDLKTINGIGPKFEGILNQVGIYNYAQIAAWGEDDINWVTQEIDDQTDRIRRDEWVKQAKALA